MKTNKLNEEKYKVIPCNSFDEILRKAREEMFNNIPPHVREVVDYFKPYIDVANLVDLKKLQTSGKDWNYDMTVFMLCLPTGVDNEFVCPVLLDWVAGCYDDLDSAINYELIYKALDRYGYVDEYNKKISKEGGKIWVVIHIKSILE